jgi:putative membrane protein
MKMSSITKESAVLIGIVSAVMTGTTALAQPPGGPQGYPYGPGMMGWSGWYGMILGPLFMIIVLAAVIAVTALLLRWIGGPWHGPPHSTQTPGRTPLDILKERYARGEIDKTEFDERRRVISE